VFSITDNMGHVFWTYIEPSHPNYHKPEAAAFREAFFHAYEQCDTMLGDMMAWAGPDTTTIIISDHGFGSIYPRQYLFRRLTEGGFLKYESPPFFSIFGDRLMKLAMKAYTGLPFLR
ncbi:MAG: alkaline phosphatase family protein, partial [Anaerolineales bacterium]|nr:alkaline phosphatase family protein [Anaerolineales bacterium]